MSRELESIDLCLENCEVITLSAKEVSHIYFKQAPKCYYTNCGRWFQHEMINDVGIVLNIDRNKTHNSFGIEDYNVNVFDRLCGNDITQITIYFEEEHNKIMVKREEHFHVVWHDTEDEYGMDCQNKNQKTEWVEKNEEEDVYESFCRITINEKNNLPIK